MVGWILEQRRVQMRSGVESQQLPLGPQLNNFTHLHSVRPHVIFHKHESIAQVYHGGIIGVPLREARQHLRGDLHDQPRYFRRGDDIFNPRGRDINHLMCKSVRTSRSANQYPYLFLALRVTLRSSRPTVLRQTTRYGTQESKP